MPKISYSLAIAFALHIFFLAGSTYFIDRGPTPFLIDPKSLINVQFGDSTGGASKKRTSSVILNSASKSLFSNEMSTSKIESASQNTAATGASNGAGSVSGSGSASYDFATSAVNYKEPVYPRLAIKRELQGNVKVRVAVTSEGKPSNLEILKSSGHDLLDKAALDAMADWRFLPRAAPYFVEKNIVFQLKN